MRALVFSGGGAKIHYHAGAASALFPRARYDLLAGVSAGALVAAHLAQFGFGRETQASISLTRQVKRLRTKDVLEPWPFIGRLAGLWRSSFYSSEPLQELVKREISVKKVRESGRLLRIGAVNMHSGELSAFTEACPNLHDAILASAAYPAILEPVSFGGAVFIDGGVRAYTPIGAVIAAGATEIDVVLPESSRASVMSRNREDALAVAGRAVDLMLNEIMAKDLQLADLHNALVRAGAGRGGKRLVTVTVIRPSRGLGVDMFDFESPKALEAFDRGVEDARRVLVARDEDRA